MDRVWQKLEKELARATKSLMRANGAPGFEGRWRGNPPLLFRWVDSGGVKRLVPCLKMWRLAVILEAWRQGGLSDRRIVERSWKLKLEWRDGKAVERQHLRLLRLRWAEIPVEYRRWFEREVWLRWPRLCAVGWVPAGPCSPERRREWRKRRRQQARKARNARAYRERKRLAEQNGLPGKV